MIVASALSYLVAGFVAALIAVYFVVQSARAFAGLLGTSSPAVSVANPSTAGGLGVVIPVLAYLSLRAVNDPGIAGLVAGCAVLTVAGVLDDALYLRRWGGWLGGRGANVGGRILAAATVAWFMAAAFGEAQWPWTLVLGVALTVMVQVSLFANLDRVEGIAAVQCLVFCVGVQVLTLGIPGWVGDLTWVLAGSVVGFLVYNWPPARSLAGGAGRALLGLMIAIIGLYVWRSDLLPPIACLILLTALWFDVCYTGCVRIIGAFGATSEVGAAGASQYRYLYQRLAEKRGPRWTNVAYLALGVCWLIPLAWLSQHSGQLDMVALALAVLPLVVAARALHAGTPAPDEG